MEIKDVLRMCGLFVFAIIVLMVHNCVWNTIHYGNADRFFIIPSLINFAAEGFGIYWLAKHWANEE